MITCERHPEVSLELDWFGQRCPACVREVVCHPDD
jgi:hypothetical protein